LYIVNYVQSFGCQPTSNAAQELSRAILLLALFPAAQIGRMFPQWRSGVTKIGSGLFIEDKEMEFIIALMDTLNT